MTVARQGRGLGRIATGLVVFAATWSAASAADVLTQHNDRARSGANLNETKLNTGNVKVASFGKLCFREVDGNPYAQPLYASQVDITGKGKRDVVIVATEGNSVYAFDASNTTQGDPAALLWHKGPEVFGTPIPTPELLNDLNKAHGNEVRCGDLTTQVGITGTPVISDDRTTLYVAAKSWNPTTRKYFYTLHAIKLADGSPQTAPVPIAAEKPGTGRGQAGGKVAFQPLFQLNRPGLLLQNGVVYVGFGGHCDRGPYHGWLFAFQASDLKFLDAYLVTPDGNLDQNRGEGGVWQSGQGPAGDADGNVYFTTGDGTFKDSTGTLTNSSDSVVKLKLVVGKFQVVDWFTPFNQDFLEKHDADLGSAGPMLVPDSKRLVAGGKEGKFYLIDREHMGHKGAHDDGQIVQSFQVTHAPFNVPTGVRFFNIHGAPVYYSGPAGRLVYVCGEEDFIKAFRLVDGTGGLKFNPATPFLKSNVRAPFDPTGGSVFMPGGILSVSADGAKAGTGILWVAMPFDASANQKIVPGILRAFDAADLTKELWNSRRNVARDNLGLYPKFCAPTVADGKVFMPAFAAERPLPHPNGAGDTEVDPTPGKERSALAVYGLLGSP